MNAQMITGMIIGMLGLIFAGIGIAIGGPILLAGYDEVRSDPSIGNFTSAETVVESSPTLFFLGFMVTGAITSFLGIAVGGMGVYKKYKEVRG